MNENDTARPADFWPLSLHAIALVLPLLLIAAGPALDPTFGESDAASYLGSVNAAPALYLISGLLVMAGMMLLPLTAAALLRVAAPARRRALLRIGAILLGAWGVLGVAGVATGYTAGWVAAGISDPAGAADVLHGVTYAPWGMFGGTAGGIAYFGGVILTGIGLLLARRTPGWAGWALLLSPAGALLANAVHVQLLAAVGMAVAAAALGTGIPALLRSARLVPADSVLTPFRLDPSRS
ncbi:MAG: hypothetical protein JST25_07610 [Actinobacteria bacterium]|nr:hypothetical protein [Actinomycetota bacterium]